jgi:hypothetical protein
MRRRVTDDRVLDSGGERMNAYGLTELGAKLPTAA